MDAPNNNVRVAVFTDVQLQDKMILGTFDFSRHGRDNLTPPLLERFTSVVTMGGTY